ncbi:DoxX family membrane protein [candidate division KSB1 bacterium]|nr:DoxX family membrane protein [candidate division KSB1 bacterium]
MSDRKKLLEWAIRWILGLVFIIAGVPKIIDPAGFAVAVDNYRLLPYFIVVVMALVLPWLEVFIGLALISGRLWRGGALLTIGLYGVFIIAIGSAMMRGLDIDCGCFSTGEHDANFRRIIEDVILMAGALWIYRRGLQKNNENRPVPAD